MTAPSSPEAPAEVTRLRALATALGDTPMAWTLLAEAADLERQWLNEPEETP